MLVVAPGLTYVVHVRPGHVLLDAPGLAYLVHVRPKTWWGPKNNLFWQPALQDGGFFVYGHNIIEDHWYLACVINVFAHLDA